jgi:hypothetical protein
VQRGSGGSGTVRAKRAGSGSAGAMERAARTAPSGRHRRAAARVRGRRGGGCGSDGAGWVQRGGSGEARAGAEADDAGTRVEQLAAVCGSWCSTGAGARSAARRKRTSALEQEHAGAGAGAGTCERVALARRRGWSSSAGRRA